jgi:hypothetical protein
MFHQSQLAAALAIAISACGTMGSAYAGGFGGFGGGGHGGGHSGHSHSGHSHNGGFNGGNVIHSGNLGGINLGGSNHKPTPKNTGVVPPVVRTGGSNNSGGGIKVPGLGTLGNNHSNKNSGNNGGSNLIKKISGNGSNIQSQVLGGLGIKVGSSGGNGSGNGPGNGSGNGNGNSNGNSHHHHHHNGFPLVLTLPACNSNYCPPCPPIYYPQPYPVAVPVAVPVEVPVPMPLNVVDPNVAPAGGAEPVGPQADPGLPMDTQQEGPVAAEGPIAAAPPTEPAAQPNQTETVSNGVPLPQIPVGATLTLQGKDLTDKQGQVVLQLGEIALPATIKEWKNDSVICTLPVLGLTKASKATLHVLKADGKTASTLNCELVTSLPTSAESSPAASTALDGNKYEQ